MSVAESRRNLLFILGIAAGSVKLAAHGCSVRIALEIQGLSRTLALVLELQKRFAARIRSILQSNYQLDFENIPIETPPDLKLGELATPIALQLARTLRKAPKIIAQEIAAALTGLEGFSGFEIAGAGYINARIDRAALARIAATSPERSPSAKDHSLVEHTSINPNKAAHIGHLRNAILGDTFVRLLRAGGQTVTVQNYIDNTGVQVADVVVGFQHLESRSLADVRAIIDECERRTAGAAWAQSRHCDC